MKPINNIREFYILERPIKTDIGNLHHTKVINYPELMEFAGVLMFDKVDLRTWIVKMKRQITQQLKISSDLIEREYLHRYFKSLEETMKLANELELFDFIKFYSEDCFSQTPFYSLYLENKRMFEFFFKDDVFDNIKTSKEYEYYLELIRDVNCIDYEKANPNPNIERRNIVRRLMKKSDGEAIDFESMVTSIEVETGLDAFNMSVYRFNKIFERIGQFKEYEMTKLYRLFSSEVKISSWAKIIEKTEREYSYLSHEDLELARKGNGVTDIKVK